MRTLPFIPYALYPLLLPFLNNIDHISLWAILAHALTLNILSLTQKGERTRRKRKSGTQIRVPYPPLSRRRSL
jgi:hypothetical protein